MPNGQRHCLTHNFYQKLSLHRTVIKNQKQESRVKSLMYINTLTGWTYPLTSPPLCQNFYCFLRSKTKSNQFRIILTQIFILYFFTVICVLFYCVSFYFQDLSHALTLKISLGQVGVRSPPFSILNIRNYVQNRWGWGLLYFSFKFFINKSKNSKDTIQSSMW